MTEVINALGVTPNTYVLVTLRSDASMIDLLTITQSATNLTPTTWGSTVKTYLLSHAN